MAVGAALFSRSSRSPAPALAELETLEFWERGSYIQPISRTCLTRTPEGTRSEEELVKFDCSNCSANQLTELDVDVTHKPNLERVECQNNQLTSLILGQNKLLKKLNCAHNQLTQLNLNNMISLKDLNCFNNQLTVLDVSDSPKLTTLWLGDNHLTSLNLDNNPKLDFSLTDIYSGDNVYTVTLNPGEG